MESHKTTSMIEEQRDSEAGEIDRGEKGLHDSRRKSIRKERMGIKKVAKVQEKREQERELIQP